MSEHTVRGQIGDREIIISTGKLARQANGAVRVSMGGTEALVAATANSKPRESVDFFPLTIDVEERMYAVGKIPGSFFRREGRATERATLSARLIDRPLRPSFRDGYRNDTHVVVTVLQVDGENAYDVLALNGASTALTLSDLPFEGPIGAVRLALKDGNWVPFPTFAELEECVFDLVVAGRRSGSGDVDIVMVEAGATDIAMDLISDGQAPPDEEKVAEGLEVAKEHIGALTDLQSELRSMTGKEVRDWPVLLDYTDEVYERVSELVADGVAGMVEIADKAANCVFRHALSFSELLAVEARPLLESSHGPISSSFIRRCIADGDVTTAGRLLGRLHELPALVTERGPEAPGYGLPTAHLEVDRSMAVPGQGVYAGWIVTGDETLPVLCGIGARTVSGSGELIRVHMLEPDRKLGAREAAIRFAERLTDQPRADAGDEGTGRRERAVARALRLLGRTGP